MHQNNKNQKSDLPKRWFFFNPTIDLNHRVFYNLSNKIGVVFFNTDRNQNFHIKIQPFVQWCNKKQIKFMIPYSSFWAYRNSAYGFFTDSNYSQNFKLPNLKIPKKAFVATKVHSLKEARAAIKYADIIFITPIFKTLSHPKQTPMPRDILIKLCLFFKEQMIFGLGGVNEYNFKFVKKYNLYGFGGISNFGGG